MANLRRPRCGSMQIWPRKHAKRAYARVRSWAKKPGILGFAGYKAGMTHVIVTDNRKNALTLGQDVSFPVTIVECPPIKVAGICFYKKNVNGLYKADFLFGKPDKELRRKISLPKQPKEKTLNPEDYADIRLLVYTQPKLVGIGKKKPELFELAIHGTIKEKFDIANSYLHKELRVEDVFSPGQQLDAHAVSIGKGFQGPVKRFGVSIRSHKAEKTKRGPGSLGGWRGQGHTMYRIAHAGRMGYHTRTEFNKQILKISNKIEEINPKGGFIRYGNVKTSYLLLKGSVPGPKKRLIRLCHSIRPNKKLIEESPQIQYISLESKQGK